MKKLYYFFAFFFSISHITVFTQTHTFTGNGGDNNWFNEDNWDSGTIPSNESEVLIPSGFSVEISSETAYSLSVAVEGSSTLTIENNLNLYGSLTIASGSTINWYSGSINGGGTIVNDGLIQIESLGLKKLINTSLDNNAVIAIDNSNEIKLSGGSIVNNNESGAIEIYDNGGLAQLEAGNTVNNTGSIRKFSDGSGNLGSFYMIFDFNNSGTIQADANQQFLFLGLGITLNNMESGIMKGFGAFDITANFINHGTIAPGSEEEIGKLDIINYLTLSPQSILEFDIAGKMTGEFDVIEIVGFPDLMGNIVVNLLYEPDLGDQFPIIFANEIESCDFPSEIKAEYEGYEYSFSVSCTDTEVILEVTDIVLDIDEFDSESITFQVHPNPVKSTANISFDIPEDLLPQNKFELRVISSQGKEVIALSGIFGKNHQLDAGKLQAGMYILQLKSGRKLIATKKLIVE